MHLTTTRRRPRRTLALATALAGTVLALSACSGGGAAGGGGGNTGDGITVFNGATGNIAENWNPFTPTALQPTLGIIHEPLFYYNLASSDAPEPLLGTEFSWNEDGSQLTVTIREGVEWSDGEPFTTEDVAYNFNLRRETPEFNTSGQTPAAEAISDTQVVLTFDSPASYTQEANTLGNTPMIPQHVWEAKSDPVTDINADPVGTGPYTVGSINAQTYELEANPTYWGGEPKIPTVRYISLANADAASSALLAGEVDWMSSFFPGFEDLIASEPDLAWVNTPALTTSLFTCSNAALGCEGPQTDPAVRQAIYYAVDRDQLNNLAFEKVAELPSPTLLIPGRDDQWVSGEVEATAPSGADVAQATQILEAAGYAKGGDGIYAKGGQRVSLNVQVVSGYSDYIAAIDAMTQQLAAAGIELTSSQVAYNEWSANQQNGTFQLSMDSIGLGASTDPYFTYQPRYATESTVPVGESAGALNNARYSNPVVDAAVAAAGSTDDDAVKAEQYAIIQKEIARDMPYIPLVISSTLTEFNTSRATGWPTEDDLYAFPATWKAWDNGIVLKNLKPAN